jgi:hypothetical protein
MVLSPPLATADQIVLQHAELLQVLADVRKRNKGGRNDKHDKARVRFIEDFALRGRAQNISTNIEKSPAFNSAELGRVGEDDLPWSQFDST